MLETKPNPVETTSQTTVGRKRSRSELSTTYKPTLAPFEPMATDKALERSAAANNNSLMIHHEIKIEPKKEASTPPDSRSEESDQSSDDGSSAFSEDNNEKNGRFDLSEKETLFNMIEGDAELLRAFLHHLTKRKWNGKSWMHEIAKRYNEIASQKRKADAVRHHLKLRLPKGVTIEDDKEKLAYLLDHSRSCDSKSTCSRCFQLHRYRVKLGHARCGVDSCTVCDRNKPFVLEPFSVEAESVLLQIKREGEGQMPTRLSDIFPLSQPERQSQQRPLSIPISPILNSPVHSNIGSFNAAFLPASPLSQLNQFNLPQSPQLSSFSSAPVLNQFLQQQQLLKHQEQTLMWKLMLMQAQLRSHSLTQHSLLGMTLQSVQTQQQELEQPKKRQLDDEISSIVNKRKRSE